MSRCGELQFLQRFQSALHLPRLTGLGAEAVDEAHDLFGFARLTTRQSRLAGEIVAALTLERTVVAAVDRRPTGFQMYGVIDHGIEEFAIVSDHQQRA